MKRVALILGLSACTPAPLPPQTGMANPASVYCTDQGGTLTMTHTAAGQTGHCHLPNGRIVEQWAFYRETHP